MENTIVEINDLTLYQDDSPVLHNISFNIDKGEFVYLVGRTGSGKSSLLKAIYADLPVKKGSIKFSDFEIENIKRADIPFLRRKLGIVFQDFELFRDRTVHENLEFVLKATGWTAAAKIKARISEVLMKVGLESSAPKMPHQLSGGEQQRVVIARALLNEPLLLIADEPTGNLDPEVSQEIMKLFISINNSGTSILMATHDHDLFEKFPARTLVCRNSTIEEAKVKRA